MKSTKPSKGQPIPDGWFADLWQDIKSNEITCDQFVDEIKTKTGTVLTVNYERLAEEFVGKSGGAKEEKVNRFHLENGYFFTITDTSTDTEWNLEVTAKGIETTVKLNNICTDPGSWAYVYFYGYLEWENGKVVCKNMYAGQTTDERYPEITIGPRMVKQTSLLYGQRTYRSVYYLGEIIIEVDADGKKSVRIWSSDIEIDGHKRWASDLNNEIGLTAAGTTRLDYKNLGFWGNPLQNTIVYMPDHSDPLPLSSWESPDYGTVFYGVSKDSWTHEMSLVDVLGSSNKVLSIVKVFKLVDVNGNFLKWIPTECSGYTWGYYSKTSGWAYFDDGPNDRHLYFEEGFLKKIKDDN